MRSPGSRMIHGWHLQAISIVFFDERVELVSSLVKAFANSSTFWDCNG